MPTGQRERARPCAFLIPGDWLTPTGGYRYDRRIVLGLRAAGWTIDHVALPDGFPWPGDTARAQTRQAVEALPDGTLAVVDGLAFGALPELLREHATRLHWIALVHHPLHLETGLAPTAQDALFAQEREALRCASQVIVTSRRTAADVERMGVTAARIAVVEPGTDAAPSRKRERSPGALRLLCVASLVPRKGHALLLDALAGLTEQDWQLHCVGSARRDIDTATLLHAKSRQPPLAGRVHWHGELDDDALAAQFAAADLFVLPSLHEGYGMAVAEALAAGLPVVASDAGALAQTLPPGAGVQVPAGDVTALRAALATLIGDPAERARCAAAANAAAAALPNWTEAAARFAAVLERVG